jgi:thiol:disulfide interchange protein DsbD
MFGAAFAAAPATPLAFKSVETPADLQRELAAAAAAKKSVMLWVRADWALAGQEMEKKTFVDRDVISATRAFVLLRADVTNFDSEDKALLAQLELTGAPAVLFYGADGEEQRNFRVLGFRKAAAFVAMIRAASATAPDKTP